MAERRLPFAVQDDEGVQRRGEVVIVPAWRDDIRPSPDAAFTIVLAERPLTNGARIDAPGMALCAPAEQTRIERAAGEARVAYVTNGESAPPLRLPKRALAAYASGTLLAGHPVSITAAQVFGSGRLDALARALLGGERGAQRAWQALDAVLSWPDAPSKLSRPSALRTRLRQLLKNTTSPPFARDALDRLQAIGGDAEPSGTPGALAEDAALLRCLSAQGGEAAELAAMRSYLEDAFPAPHQRELVVDHASTRERLSYVALLSEAHSLGGMRAAFETYRAAYASAYATHHASYWKAAARAGEALEAARPIALALGRLNSLSALGRPLGRAALREYASLERDVTACTRSDLVDWLAEAPRCPGCAIAMEDEAARERTETLVARLRDALERQQARLANEAIRRILARGGERIEQFLQIVQASDQAGLARVLDDDLLGFLRDLLSQPVAITTDAVQVLDALARAHPVVRADDIDAAAETLRALLAERTGAKGEVRLASPPS